MDRLTPQETARVWRGMSEHQRNAIRSWILTETDKAQDAVCNPDQTETHTIRNAGRLSMMKDLQFSMEKALEKKDQEEPTPSNES